MVTAPDQPLERRHRIALDRHPFDLKRELLLGEAPRGVVVLERDLRAGDAEILGLHIQPRQRNEALDLLLEVADRHGCACGGWWRLLSAAHLGQAKQRYRQS